MPALSTLVRKHLELTGVLQGVGFRPFVYRIAAHFGVRGWVCNASHAVILEVEAEEEPLAAFLTALEQQRPPLARIDRITISDLQPAGDASFEIRASDAVGPVLAQIPPDLATCDDCLRELHDPTDRRFAYPFINCTNCGPRYTILRQVPYDRHNTTMSAFPLCPACLAEYRDPANRRFHAEPNACPACGPRLTLVSGEQRITSADAAPILARVRQLLRDGAILALKGLGGFHLCCDATHDAAVRRLRERKHRAEKPFAVMVPDLAIAEHLCRLSAADRQWLADPRRPIVIAPRAPVMERATHPAISDAVAPGRNTLGLLLPYTGLHHLLFASDGPSAPELRALVMTSGNLSEEPLAFTNDDALARLAPLADAFLLHDRDIQTCADDSVLRTFPGQPYPIRRSRGFAPQPLDLDLSLRQARPLREVIAVGGDLKNTLCLTQAHRAILSAHIGDLENLETLQLFRATLASLPQFHGVHPEAIACDLHPGYFSTRYATEESGLPAIFVQHHHAHIASCMADNALDGPVIGVAFDGSGYGPDGTIWGGEFLIADYAHFERRGHLRPIALAGGDQAVRQPWRSALAYLLDAGEAPPSLPALTQIPRPHLNLVGQMLQRHIHTVATSSCGRFFDAASALLGLCLESHYEGQAAIALEVAAASLPACEPYPFVFEEGPNQAGPQHGLAPTPWQADLRPAIRALIGDLHDAPSISNIARRLHSTLAELIVQGCLRLRATDGLNRVCLSGGVFQNLLLLEDATRGLEQHGFVVYRHHRVPPNDGGLALGQAAIASEVLHHE